MDTLINGLMIRRPSRDDVHAVLNLMNACDISENGEPDSDLNSLLDDWKKLTLDLDAWIAIAPGKRIVGYAAVINAGQRLRFDLYTHPTLASADLAIHLLKLCEVHAQKLHTDSDMAGTAIVYVAQSNTQYIHMMKERGYIQKCIHFGMRIGMEIQPQVPVWPIDMTLRNIKPGYDDRMVYDFIQTAFDKPGRTPPTYDRWHDFMMGAFNFNPGLWFLAYHEDELIGAILCFEYPQYGWVRQLGVSPKWRGKGIGMALLQYVFRIFYDRGYTTVGLGVESENTKAFLLYEKAGMKRKRCYIEYQKEIASEG